MNEVYAELTELHDGRWMVELSNRSEVLGPFTVKEIRALLEALEEWQEDAGF